MKNKPTIKEIAQKAGVSHTVVSVILNKKENKGVFVSQEKKKEILGLIEQFDYIPSKSARALVSQKTNTIGLIFHRLTPYYSSLLEELQRHAFKKGLEIMPYITDGYAEREEEYLNLMRDGRVDGVITAAFVEESPARYLKFSSPPYNLKIVTISPPVGNLPSVHWDEEEAGKLAAAHLAEIGCQRLCFLGRGTDSGRAKGFIKYIKEKKRRPPLLLTEECLRSYFEDGRKLAKRFLQLKELPDGVFAYNDLLAVALLSELLRNGIKVPDDVALIGCDNTEICLHSYPALTSIDTNVSQTAKVSLEKFIDHISGKKLKALDARIRPKLIARESTRKNVRGGVKSHARENQKRK